MSATSWKGFRSVLCPVDFSEASRLALRYAEAVAERGHGALTVVYVNDPLLVAAAAAALNDREFAKRSFKELDAFVGATLRRRTSSGLRVRVMVATGSATEEIIALATRRRSDLIVMGTHGLTGARRVFMGSTALGVLKRTVVPVLVVPQVVDSRDVPAGWPGDRLVAPVDLASSAGHDVEVAAEFARWFGAGLLLVHALEPVMAPAWLSAELSAHERIQASAAARRLEVLAAGSRRLVPTDARVVSGWAADEIAALAGEHRTGLIVAALHDRQGWFGSARASVSYHILSHAVAPVLVHPPRWRQ